MTMTMARRLGRTVAMVVVALLVTASACGGGDSGDRDDGDGAASGETIDNRDSETASAEMSDVELATEAYVAGYPLVVSMRTMQRLGGLAGVNRLTWQRSLSGPESRIVVAPNRDTLYSFAVLDLRSGPMVLTLPEVTDRYFSYQLLDAWTESFAYVGTRATGGRAGTWVITPPGWRGNVPDGAETVEATTSHVFLLGRYIVDDEADIANVTAVSERSSLRPLSAVTGGEAPSPPPPLGQPAGAPQDIPTDATFFDELGAALADNAPPTPAQRDLFALVEGLGIGAGERPSVDATPEQRSVLDDGAALGDKRIAAGAGGGQDAGSTGWDANREVGRYGDDTLLRAVVARAGWGANVPEEAVYTVARVDGEGAALDGGEGRGYRITFPDGGLPPVDAFWSLSVYGADMFFAQHPSGRYSIGDRTQGLVYGDDGSLEIVLSNGEPAGHRSNWLPVPDGPFVLMLRLYLPGQDVLDGDYDYPPIEPL